MIRGCLALILTMLISAVTVAAEQPKAQTPAPGSQAPASAKPSKTRAEIDAALDRVEANIKDLEAKSKDLSQKANQEWDSAIADLKRHGEKLRAELKEGSEEAGAKTKDFWGRMKAAVKELEKGVADAGKRLKGENKTPQDSKSSH
jgi:hypothetical protein